MQRGLSSPLPVFDAADGGLWSVRGRLTRDFRGKNENNWMRLGAGFANCAAWTAAVPEGFCAVAESEHEASKD